MKTPIIQTTPGMSRAIKGLVATLSIIAATAAVAAPKPLAEVSAPLAGEKFGAGKKIEVSSKNKSGPTYVIKSTNYTYRLSGTCIPEKGSILSEVFGDSISIEKFVESISSGGSKFLSDDVSNPGGKLPLNLLTKTFKGTRVVKGIGTVKISFKVVADILASGECVMNITNVKFSSVPKQKLGTISFKNGSKITVTAAPLFAILNDTKNVNEKAPSVTIQVTRLQNFKGTYTVDYTTVNGTADTTDDYVLTKGTLVFAENDAAKFQTITVPIIDNEVVDGSRTFTLQLSNPSDGAFLGTFPAMVVTIADND